MLRNKSGCNAVVMHLLPAPARTAMILTVVKMEVVSEIIVSPKLSIKNSPNNNKSTPTTGIIIGFSQIIAQVSVVHPFILYTNQHKTSKLFTSSFADGCDVLWKRKACPSCDYKNLSSFF